MRDENDRRRTLVWLTDAGRERLIDEQRVLSLDALTRAFAGMTPTQRAHLLEGTHALLSAVTTPTKKETRR
jgi:DNA-binding MarR family transcriptional regulator